VPLCSLSVIVGVFMCVHRPGQPLRSFINTDRNRASFSLPVFYSPLFIDQCGRIDATSALTISALLSILAHILSNDGHSLLVVASALTVVISSPFVLRAERTRLECQCAYDILRGARWEGGDICGGDGGPEGWSSAPAVLLGRIALVFLALSIYSPCTNLLCAVKVLTKLFGGL
jgi:hypothetical protein